MLWRDGSGYGLTMAGEDLPARPAWWGDAIPLDCPNCGRPLRPGKVRFVGWTVCTCPGARHGGHHTLYCAWDVPGPGACSWSMEPPGHDASYETPEPPRRM